MKYRPTVIVVVGLLLGIMFPLTSFSAQSGSFKLPPFIAISTMEVGTSGYNSVSMACEAITQMTDQKDDVRHAVTPEQFDLPHGEGPAGHIHQALGDAFRLGTQPRGEAPGEDGNRQSHPNRTFVPSKSKRKRTSRIPAMDNACRRRAFSSA